MKAVYQKPRIWKSSYIKSASAMWPSKTNIACRQMTLEQMFPITKICCSCMYRQSAKILEYVVNKFNHSTVIKCCFHFFCNGICNMWSQIKIENKRFHGAAQEKWWLRPYLSYNTSIFLVYWDMMKFSSILLV